MNVNERLDRLERSAGKGEHDLLMKLDALSRQIQHQETLIKALEDANQDRYLSLVKVIEALPQEFKGTLKLPLCELPITLGPADIQAEHERALDFLSGHRSAVHEKPHP